jgi:hypothetical protein
MPPILAKLSNKAKALVSSGSDGLSIHWGSGQLPGHPPRPRMAGVPASRRHAMLEKAQIELAKTLWDQTKAAALQAHDGWDMVMKAQKTWMDSMRGTGPAFEMAADQYDKLMEFHSKQYKAALDYMNKISADYQQTLTKSKK